MMQMHQLDARIARMITELEQLSRRVSLPIGDIQIARHGADGAPRPFVNGDTWARDGEWWDFTFRVTVPDSFRGRVLLRARTGREHEWEATNPQFVAWIDGEIAQALDTKHTALTLQQEARPGVSFDILLNGYAAPTDPSRPLPTLTLTLEDIHEPLRQLVYDLSVPLEASMLVHEGDRDRETTLETLARGLDLLDIRQPYSEAFDASIEKARVYLQNEYYAKRAALPPVATAMCVGHTHIDVAWLWDLEQTRHKAVRSFSTVLKLMEQYPEYKFMSSQAALYNMVKQDAPALYDRIQEAVREGRWEVEGGMWVEADTNLASGESLVRQLLHGQEFFLREFGKLSRILWLPDVFGYSAALPQILKLSGIDYFMTTKLSWSEFNLSPYDTFTWEGIDGSNVLTHFSPARDYTEGDASGHEGLPHFTTYNAMLCPKQISGGWQRFQQKGLDSAYLICYGYGDGGGGATDWMLENARRMEGPLPGTPAVRQTHARPFFEALEARVSGDPRLPKWVGELYLEYHRGTYTAMARNKRANRKIELMLRETELWSVYAAQMCGVSYPAQALHEIWEDVLTLQFHDILPGSSIKKVYDDSQEMYSRLFESLGQQLAAAQDALCRVTPGDIAAFNSLSHLRDDIVWFDAPGDVTHVRDAAGVCYPVQHALGRACAYVRGLSPLSVTPLWFVRGEASNDTLRLTTEGFDTPFYTGAFGHGMRMESLVHKATGRQIARPGEALNRIVCYENKPHNYDAWDINIYYNRRFWEVDGVQSAEVIANGPVLAILRVTIRYLSSAIQQDIVFYRDMPRIDFDTTVDWREKQYMLKAHFPVDVFYTEATYDIQYGNIRRATHKNTTWDVARFEVCAHKWADVSEDGFGVSLLNDCKYGHSIDEHSMALTLLKSSTHPNPEADQETHRFTYALLPHVGGWREGRTVEEAYQLNTPVLASPGNGGGDAIAPFASVDAPNLVIESVKQALDGNGVIVRLYECYGRRTDATLSLHDAPRTAAVCDLLERELEDAQLDGNVIALRLRPYEIKSIRVSF